MVRVYIYGNGSAFVNKDHPENGDEVVITSTPDIGWSLYNIIVTPQHGDPIPVQIELVTSFYYLSEYGDVYVEVVFTDSPTPPPPPPPTETKHKMPIWMYPTIRRKL